MRKLLLALAAIVSFMAVLVFVLVAFGLPLGPSLQTIWSGAFVGETGWGRTLVNMTPLLLTGLGMTIAWRAGMYNIGGEGQYIAGGLLAASWVHFAGGGPVLVTQIVCLIGSVIGGAAYALLAVWLELKRGVQVVISTILLNFVAVQLLAWAVGGPLKDPAGMAPQTRSVPDQVMLASWSTRSDLHSGVAIAVVVAFGMSVLLTHTSTGVHLKAIGASEPVARAARLPVPKLKSLSMGLSGGLCGLAGGIQFLGISGVLDSGFNQQWGFLGIPVALLGGLNALGVLASAFLFGGLLAGTQALSRTSPGGDLLIFVIQAVLVLAFIGFHAWRRRREGGGGV